MAKYELTKKMFFRRKIWGSEIRVFGEERGVTCYLTDKRHKTQSMTKKRSSEIFGIFSLKEVIRKFGPRNLFSIPQTRRQVSAHGQQMVELMTQIKAL